MRTVDIKVFSSDHRSYKRVRMYAPEGTQFDNQGAQNVASNLLSQIRGAMPLIKFQCVRVAKNKFNIVHEVGQA